MRLILALLAVTMLAFVLAGNCFSACIRGEHANFDVHNFTNQPINDFMLVLWGIKCKDIAEYYFPEMYDSIRCSEGEPGTIIKWYFQPVEPCNWIHFGVRLKPGVGAPIVAFAAVTLDCNPVGVIPFPWQAWRGSIECPIWDIIPGNPTIPQEGVLVQRRAAFSPADIPLNNMTIDDPMIQNLDWFYEDYQPVLLTRDEELVLEMQTNGEPSAVVIYSVNGLDGTQYLVFISQALLTYGPSETQESTWGGIKALYR